MLGRLKLMTMFLLLCSLCLSITNADSHCEFAEEAIRFGGIAPLSPPGATGAGIIIDWSFQQAAADVNAQCGVDIAGVNHRVEVLTGDSEGISERGQALAERWIFEDGVHGVVGGYHSAVALATMLITQENRIPTLFAGPWNDNITANGIIEFEGRAPRSADGLDYIFRTSPANSMVAAVVANWFIALGLDDVIIMTENTDYGIPAAADEAALLEAAGMTVEQYSFELGTEDFVPVLNRVLARAEPPDAIRVLVTGETGFNLVQQMAELGIAPSADTICVAESFAGDSTQFWAAVPDGNYCAFTRVGATPALFGDIAHDVNDRYTAEWGGVAPSYSLEPYDSVRLLAAAMDAADSFTDAEAIVAALETIDIELAQGRYFFEYGSHNPDLPEDVPTYLWHQWPDPIVTVVQYFEQDQSALDAAVIYPPVYQTHGSDYIQPGTTP
ncbi:MAG: ABC transporter substrate-binding protein [Chloroflexi bacterium]|nr:ABC transporter substrate-binding protein [Chloroflexota bacterium]MXX84552.1 ABC transporter substrate-binding protein [Chloroflexota bacterium]MYA93377.1 ABC transporter substrate-binding protein [Chloroflexota bacterium]MYC54543.1 ABC transporter substrate-binding protein [Chloroflexota bacterium]MYD38217.1 ABC transporter substrate-binding protein [Chloroflexota bacterium]